MPKRKPKYGAIGRTTPPDEITFMVIAPKVSYQDKDITEVVILEGRTTYLGKRVGPGDIGPVQTNANWVTWFDE